MPDLDSPVRLGGLELPNRLYRAPLLECAGNGPDAPETLRAALEPAAASGVGLVCQGATVVRGEGGCAAPNMTRVHDPDFVERLSVVPEAVHDHGGRVFVQLEHGGLRSMETWHAGYRESHPDLEQLAVSRPPRPLRVLDRAGILDYDPHVLSTAEVYGLAADFGRAAGYAVDAGYDGVHVAGANMGVVQQFLSPFYNRRDDEFGRDRFRFLDLVLDEVRERVGDDVPVMTKVPAETEAPPFVRRRLSLDDGVALCERAVAAGFDAVVPVKASVFWDMSLVRGEFPGRAWRSDAFADGYEAAFGGPLRWRLLALANWVESRRYDFEPAWNADYCRRVRERVDAPVLCEGGLRERDRMDALLGDACDAAGVGRPFYAEPGLGAELLGDGAGTAACESCNNCVVPQATGAPGACRTPAVQREAQERRARRAGDDGASTSRRE